MKNLKEPGFLSTLWSGTTIPALDHLTFRLLCESNVNFCLVYRTVILGVFNFEVTDCLFHALLTVWIVSNLPFVHSRHSRNI